MLTRRCIDRKMLMLADSADGETVNQHIKFALAQAAEIAGVELHAWEVMSNHLHVLFSDLKTNANFPSFAQALDSAIARNVNAIRGRFGTFWDGEGPLFTALPTGEDVMRDMVYTVTNSSDAGLVKWGNRWPGVNSYGSKIRDPRDDPAPGGRHLRGELDGTGKRGPGTESTSHLPRAVR